MTQSQTTSHILMVRPASFGFNAQTAESNAFQNQIEGLSQAEISQKAQAEFDEFVAKLRSKGIHVQVIEDTKTPEKPDAIFPNNWVSFHADGRVFLYPMCTPNRRLERRNDIIETIASKFEINQVRDLSVSEAEGKILEGTGSMVLDHIHQIVYACLSPRTEKSLLEDYAKEIGYEAVVFTSLDEKEGEVYHTNVVMCMGKGFAVICLDTIQNAEEREYVTNRLKQTGNEIVDISLAQMNRFAGNMLQVENAEGKTFLVMSQTAYNALTDAQVQQLSAHTEILPVQIDTIETIGGGSARCMMAEIFCKEK